MPGGSKYRWLWGSVAVVVADQITKYAVNTFTPEEYSRAVIPGLLNLVHRRNPGVAFGILADSESELLRAGLLLFSIGAISVLAWLLATNRAGASRGRAGLALILGGAAGNAIDRVLHGSVIDFIDFHVAGRHWPAFNIADSAIVIGAGLVVLELLREHSHSGSPGSPASPSGTAEA
jgi:signal peptidase II